MFDEDLYIIGVSEEDREIGLRFFFDQLRQVKNCSQQVRFNSAKSELTVEELIKKIDKKIRKNHRNMVHYTIESTNKSERRFTFYAHPYESFGLSDLVEFV